MFIQLNDFSMELRIYFLSHDNNLCGSISNQIFLAILFHEYFDLFVRMSQKHHMEIRSNQTNNWYSLTKLSCVSLIEKKILHPFRLENIT